MAVVLLDRAFVLRRDGGAVDVWPGVCPHEGAELAAAHLRGKAIACPWHGLEFPARRLLDNESGVTICGARLDLVQGKIVVRAAAAGIGA